MWSALNDGMKWGMWGEGHREDRPNYFQVVITSHALWFLSISARLVASLLMLSGSWRVYALKRCDYGIRFEDGLWNAFHP